MDFSEIMGNLNFWAVLVAALSSFAIGSIWYSKLLFGKAWMKETGITEDDAKNKGLPMPVIFGTAFVLILVGAFSLAMFIGPESNAAFGGFAGFMVGLIWIGFAFGVNYLYEMRSFKLFLINAGYNTVIFTLMGIILGAWH